LHLDDAARILGRLKSAFPAMTLDEDQAETLLKEIALLYDPAVLDEAVGHLIQREERFPPIARIRLAYRSVNDAHIAQRQALERDVAPPPDERGIPEWVHVWRWRSDTTMAARQAANTKALGPVETRPPVKMRDFPQYENPGPDAYTMEEYERIRQAWIKAGSPRSESPAEVLDGAVTTTVPDAVKATVPA